jgi:predicted DsbA family dithiol-disulfide isomerase
MQPAVTVTYFIDLISSWCTWCEPAWASVKAEFADRADFDWKIALMDVSGLPTSHEQMEWFYRRSGIITRSDRMLNSGWFVSGQTEYVAPNAVAWAARSHGITDDRARLLLAEAGLRNGEKIGDYTVCAKLVAKQFNLDAAQLEATARSTETQEALRIQTAEFHKRGATQRPSFVLQSRIGDYVLISGLISPEPLRASIRAMLDDVTAYDSYAAHHGSGPNI